MNASEEEREGKKKKRVVVGAVPAGPSLTFWQERKKGRSGDRSNRDHLLIARIAPVAH